MQKNVREWTPTLPSELPFWELECQWSLESSKGECKGQNHWIEEFLIGKLLERRCHDPFGHLKHKLWPKEGLVNWQFESWPIKIKNLLDSLACKWHATYCWKILDEGYNFALDLTSIGGFHTISWALKSVIVSILGILRLPGFRRQNDIWVLVLWASIKYYKGKVVASPSSSYAESFESMFARGRLCTKNVPTMH
jgi:hypothetical protein